MKEKLKQAKPVLKNFLNEIWPLLAFIFLAALVGFLFSPSKVPPPELSSPPKRLLFHLSQPVNIIVGVSCFTFFLLSLVNAVRFFVSRIRKDPSFVQLVYKRSFKTCVIGFLAVAVVWFFINVDILLSSKKEAYQFPEGATYEAERETVLKNHP